LLVHGPILSNDEGHPTRGQSIPTESVSVAGIGIPRRSHKTDDIAALDVRPLPLAFHVSLQVRLEQ